MDSTYGKRKRSRFSSSDSDSSSKRSWCSLRREFLMSQDSHDVRFIQNSTRRRACRSSSLSDQENKADSDRKIAALLPKNRRLGDSPSSDSSPSVISGCSVEHKIRSIVVVPPHSTIRAAARNSPSTISKCVQMEKRNVCKEIPFHESYISCPVGINEGDSVLDFQLDCCQRQIRRDSGSDIDCSWLLTNHKITSTTYSRRHSKISTTAYSSCSVSPLTLKGLDQPQPWALDLVRRSETYRSSFIDSHCHIDLLYDRLGVSHRTSFSEFRRMVACSFPANFHGLVAVFCYPKTYDPQCPQDELLQTLGCDDDIWFVIGCHPKNATEFSARHEQGLRVALNHSKVVGLGEIGLDYSGNFYRHAEKQKAILKLQLRMAMEFRLPLVVHCRDAYDDCFAIMKEEVPHSWRIHLHCFCGNKQEAERWLEAFPNLFIGLTPVITYRSAQDCMTTAQIIPLSRLLLETDSPYFVPGSIQKGRVQVSHPGFALFTAERIAELRGISVDTVLQACRDNTHFMYGI